MPSCTARPTLASTGEPEPQTTTRYDVALQRWLSLGAADLDARIAEVWDDLGLFPELLEQPTATLSGVRRRASASPPCCWRFDVYLLDEPTNDLDLDGLAMLERWIGGSGRRRDRQPRPDVPRPHGHERRRARRVHPPGDAYAGGWQAYLDERAAAERHAGSASRSSTRSARLAERAQREREWASQGQAKVKSR